MYENLKGKRLLFLGGIRALCDAVEIAKSMGIYTIVTDYLPDSPAKKVADQSFMVSTTDVDAIVKLCQEEHVDGVFTAFIDSMLPYARQICDRLGLPFYASEEQIRLSLDKSFFKETCMKYGVPVPADYTAEIQAKGIADADVCYPVIVKPIDSSGGRGVTICANQEELEKAYEYAMSISPGKHVLVEEYAEGVEVTATYTMKDGVYSLSGFKDKLKSYDHPNITSQMDILIFPSCYIERYLETVDSHVKDMLSGIHAVDGTIFLQGIATEQKILFFECGYRPNGAADYRHFSRINGINFMEMLIAHALTGRMEGYELSQDNPRFPSYILNLNVYSHGGVIGKLDGIERVKEIPNVELAEYMHDVGETIIENNTLQQRVFRAVISDRRIAEIQKTIQLIQESVKVLDSEGNSMLYLPFDVQRLNQYPDLA